MQELGLYDEFFIQFQSNDFNKKYFKALRLSQFLPMSVLVTHCISYYYYRF